MPLKSILIVDDNAVIRKALKGGLESRDGFYICGEAQDGRDAIEKAKHLTPDLIILDLSMPVMDGIEAAVVLHQLMPCVPLILYTLHAVAGLETKASSAGISAIVFKSEGLDKLAEQAQTLLRMITRADEK